MDNEFASYFLLEDKGSYNVVRVKPEKTKDFAEASFAGFSLHLSIAKWEFILEALEREVEEASLKLIYTGGASTCALCYMHLNKECRFCPVMEKTNKDYCFDTPQKDYAAIIHDSDFFEYPESDPSKIIYDLIEAAKNEIDFLRSLK